MEFDSRTSLANSATQTKYTFIQQQQQQQQIGVFGYAHIVKLFVLFSENAVSLTKCKQFAAISRIIANKW